ncbi:MAG: CHAT domain-containing protein [Aureispira sp.]|nr:CHAT domain-containing protein [Aureispira sp.]
MADDFFGDNFFEESFDDTSTFEPIYRSLYQQKCILILGPKLATVNFRGVEAPINEHFSTGLSGQLSSQNIPYDPTQKKNLAYIALRWVHATDSESAILHGKLNQFYKMTAKEVPPIYSKLAQLPLSMVLNTNPDKFIYKAFQEVGKNPEKIHYNYLRHQKVPLPEITVAKPLMYNLFGKYTDEESLVVTQDDQVDFIKNILEGKSELSKSILSHCDREKSYLFLGFEPDTWHLPLLFKSLKLSEGSSAFYINEGKSAQVTKEFYEDSFSFKFIENKKSTVFVDELVSGYEKWVKDRPDLAVNTSYVDKPQPDADKNTSTVLLMTSNPEETTKLKLNKEITMVQEALMSGTEREQFLIQPILDINKRRLQQVLLYHQPQIVHFSGHGTGRAGLIFSGDAGDAEFVTGKQLADLFSQFKGISCVLLNACFSQEQAEVLAQYIPNVIGTNNAIDDTLATVFAQGFYQALFSGGSYQSAFDQAMAHVGLHSFPEGGRPVFYKEGKKQ